MPERFHDLEDMVCEFTVATVRSTRSNADTHVGKTDTTRVFQVAVSQWQFGPCAVRLRTLPPKPLGSGDDRLAFVP